MFGSKVGNDIKKPHHLPIYNFIVYNYIDKLVIFNSDLGTVMVSYFLALISSDMAC